MAISMPNFEPGCVLANPELMSEPCMNYLTDAGRLVSYVQFVLDAAEGIDQHIAGVAQPITGVTPPSTMADPSKYTYHPIDPDYVAKLVSKGGGFIRVYFAFEALQAGMILCRSVDSFLTYLSELLALVFRTKPETLKSGESVRLDFVLQFQSFFELVDAIVDKRVNDLSYAGMEELSEYLSERLGFDLFPGKEDLKRARYLIEVRNLIVHSRGVVNPRFLRRLKDLGEDLGNPGSKILIDFGLTLRGLLFLRESVCDIDERAAQKFHLPRRSFAKAV